MIPILLPPRRRARSAHGPHDPPSGSPAKPTEPHATPAPGATRARPGGDVGELHLLIVDDDFLFTEMLPRLLRREVTRPALRITTASTPDEARARVRAERFDIVLCDFDLRAQASGIDVLAEAARGPGSPFRILISGHSPREIPDIPGVYDAFLDKPMTLREVVPQLTALLEERLGIRLERR